MTSFLDASARAVPICLLLSLLGCADNPPAAFPCRRVECGNTGNAAGEDDSGTQALPGDGDGDSVGAGDGDTTSGTFDGTGIPCAVRTLIETHCTTCHSNPPSFGAPMSLTSRADFLKSAKSGDAVYQVAKSRINASDPTLRMPPASQAPLSSDELAAINAWLDTQAAESNETCDDMPNTPDDPHNPTDTTGLTCYKLLTHAAGSKSEPYHVGTARDTYMNFSFTPPWQGTVYGIVLRPIIDNSKVIHHWLLFQQASAVEDGAVQESSGAHPSGELVYGWAPGGTAVSFRETGNAGLEFPAGSGLILETHYNSDDDTANDASGVEVCVQSEKPENVAGVSWLGTDGIFFANTASGTCKTSFKEPIHIIGDSPHMHLKGRHMKSVINRADGSTTTIHDADFSFNDQTWYKADLTLMPGDSITTTCSWDGYVSFGKRTTDEMCYLFTVAYPKGALADGMPAGTAAHGAGACLGL